MRRSAWTWPREASRRSANSFGTRRCMALSKGGPLASSSGVDSGAAHIGQNAKVAGARKPHAGHVARAGARHLGQDGRSGGCSKSHWRHFTSCTLPSGIPGTRQPDSGQNGPPPDTATGRRVAVGGLGVGPRWGGVLWCNPSLGDSIQQVRHSCQWLTVDGGRPFEPGTPGWRGVGAGKAYTEIRGGDTERHGGNGSQRSRFRIGGRSIQFGAQAGTRACG
jgi:hypothetical protein